MVKNERNYSFDMFRVVAMLLVLAVHANYFSIGAPTQMELMGNPIQSFFRIFNEQICIICVNCFILISGWFLIHPCIKSFLNLLFQISFYFIGIICVFAIFGEFSLSNLLDNISSYWFIPSYLVLYIISPILNTYIKNVPKKEYRFFLIVFFAFQFLFGWLVDIGKFAKGFSPMSFVGLYLLSHYLRLYTPTFLNSKWKCLAVCLLSTIIPTLITILGIWYKDIIIGWMINYNCPFVVLSSVSLLLLFSSFTIKKDASKIINFIGVSSFSIYLVHTHPFLINYYKKIMLYIYENYSSLIYISLVLLSIFSISITCILFDKIRLYCWNKICKI